MKKSIAAAFSVLAGLALTGCSFQDFMLYLYGGDGFVKNEEPDYASCDGDNGVTRTSGSSLSWRRRIPSH